MLIAHRCKRCEHLDFWNLNSARQGSIIHSGRLDGQEIKDYRLIRRRCNTPECQACQSFCEWGPPEPIVRFHAGAFAQRVTDLCEPGALAFGATHGLAKAYACACDDCRVLYIELLPYSGTERMLTIAEPAIDTAEANPAYNAPAVAAPAEAVDAAAPVVTVLSGQEELF